MRFPRSVSSTRDAPLEIGEDWSKVSPEKWQFLKCSFDGRYAYSQKPEVVEVRGVDTIEAALAKMRADPVTYEAIFYQSNMEGVAVQPGQLPIYNLVKRNKKNGMVVKEVAGGHFTYVKCHYEALPACGITHPDQFTDEVLHHYKGYRLNGSIQPGRGQGCADVPGVKLIDDVDPNDVLQGEVGDCWLLSAISSLSEYDGIIKHIFRKTPQIVSMPRPGLNSYTVTLYDLETWQPRDIVVDERLCSNSSGCGGLLGAQPSATGELWVCYLEKAIAAHCGGWDKIDGGTCTHAWRILLGCREQYTIMRNGGGFSCYGLLNPNTRQWEKMSNSPHDSHRGLWPMEWPAVGGGGDMNLKLSANDLFERMCEWEDNDFVMAAGTKAGSDTKDTDGIVDGHAYTILQCANDVAGTQWDLIKVRNPWGRGEMRIGKWDDDGPGWDQYPQVKAALNPVALDDGIFWLDKDEFFTYFKSVYMCPRSMAEFYED